LISSLDTDECGRVLYEKVKVENGGISCLVDFSSPGTVGGPDLIYRPSSQWGVSASARFVVANSYPDFPAIKIIFLLDKSIQIKQNNSLGCGK
jgi:hypothetical protein